MNKLEDFLEKYPYAFIVNQNSRNPFPMFGFECSDGWYDIIDPVISYINDYNKGKEEDSQIKIQQIKEKYGQLCIYINSYLPEIESLIEEAEKKSVTVCEQCGKPGMIRGRGWIYTACDDHTKSKDK